VCPHEDHRSPRYRHLPAAHSQIVSLCKDLKPILAAQYPHSNFESLCTSPVFESVLVDGKTMALTRPNGKVGAGYIRVSTPQQRSRQRQGTALARTTNCSVSSDTSSIEARPSATFAEQVLYSGQQPRAS
jgi:hypothetical protein